MEKILTIIIPTYNMEKFLDKCLTSLIIDDKELMKKLEVLVIIDGAKDRSSEIAHTYQDIYPDTYVVIDKENGNYGSCINRGLKEATGKYVKVLDADDCFDTVSFQSYLRILNYTDADLILSDFDYVYEDGTIIGKRRRMLPKTRIMPFSDVVQNFNTDLISMHELAYKTSNIKDLGYVQTEGISYTDLEWCFMPMLKVNSVYFFDKVLYKYLIGREGQTISPEVAAKNISHKILSGLEMVKSYSQVRYLEPEKDSYLRNRLEWSLGAIYEIMLVSVPTCMDIKKLMEYDDAIKNMSSSIYQLLGKKNIHPYIKFKYIESFRNSHSRNMSIKFWSMLIHIIVKIKRHEQ